MKGSIICCLQEMVVAKSNTGTWKKIVSGAGMEEGRMFLPTDNVEDKEALALIESACKVLNLSLQEAADAFGRHWMTVYAPNIYKGYFIGSNSARAFLLKMDRVHQMVTRDIAGAHPPRFDYQWEDDKTLVMTYKSSRGLIDIMAGLIKGVGAHYHEELRVEKLSGSKVKVVFP